MIYVFSDGSVNANGMVDNTTDGVAMRAEAVPLQA